MPVTRISLTSTAVTARVCMSGGFQPGHHLAYRPSEARRFQLSQVLDEANAELGQNKARYSLYGHCGADKRTKSQSIADSSLHHALLASFQVLDGSIGDLTNFGMIQNSYS